MSKPADSFYYASKKYCKLPPPSMLKPSAVAARSEVQYLKDPRLPIMFNRRSGRTEWIWQSLPTEAIITPKVSPTPSGSGMVSPPIAKKVDTILDEIEFTGDVDERPRFHHLTKQKDIALGNDPKSSIIRQGNALYVLPSNSVARGGRQNAGTRAAALHRRTNVLRNEKDRSLLSISKETEPNNASSNSREQEKEEYLKSYGLYKKNVPRKERKAMQKQIEKEMDDLANEILAVSTPPSTDEDLPTDTKTTKTGSGSKKKN